MAIEGIEWIIVAFVVIVIFLWGPEKLPQIARAVGKAKREFDKAAQGIQEEIKETTNVIPKITPDRQLLDLARSLGIKTEGLTRDQIAREILGKLTPAEKEAAN